MSFLFIFWWSFLSWSQLSFILLLPTFIFVLIPTPNFIMFPTLIFSLIPTLNYILIPSLIFLLIPTYILFWRSFCLDSNSKFCLVSDVPFFSSFWGSFLFWFRTFIFLNSNDYYILLFTLIFVFVPTLISVFILTLIFFSQVITSIYYFVVMHIYFTFFFYRNEQNLPVLWFSWP